MVELAEKSRSYVPERVITEKATLRSLMGEPSDRAKNKVLPALDPHCRALIALSPYMLLGTSDAAGRCDVSPKGDAPGFVMVVDDSTIVIPDRPGNRRVDSLQNIIENPHVGLLFLVPGMTETLRIAGSAQIVQDEALLAPLAVAGKAPTLGLLVHVEEAFLHCGKSSLRSGIWDPAKHVDPANLPSYAQMLMDQRRPAGRTDEEHARIVQENDASIKQAYCALY